MYPVGTGKLTSKTKVLPKVWDEKYRKLRPATGSKDEDFLQRHPELMEGRDVSDYLKEAFVDPVANKLRDVYRKLRK